MDCCRFLIVLGCVLVVVVKLLFLWVNMLVGDMILFMLSDGYLILLFDFIFVFMFKDELVGVLVLY